MEMKKIMETTKVMEMAMMAMEGVMRIILETVVKLKWHMVKKRKMEHVEIIV